MPSLDLKTENTWCSAPEDPRHGGIQLHPHPPGQAPVIARWNNIEGAPGNYFVSHAVSLGNPDWPGRLKVVLSVEQAGRPPTRRVMDVTRDTPVLGLAFFNAGERFNYSISITLASEHYEGSAFTLGPMITTFPIPEATAPGRLFRLDGAKATPSERLDKALVSSNQGGMMNRTYPMLSTLIAAQATGRSAYVYWGPNAHCAADFSDIYDMSGSGFEEVDASFLAGDHDRQDLYDEAGPPARLEADNVLVGATGPYATEASERPSFKMLGEAFKGLRPARAIREMLAQFDGVDFSRTIGFHVRRAYPNGAFAAMEAEKFAIGEEVFISMLEKLRDTFPQYDRAFLCTNDLGVEARIKARLGDYVFTFDKTSIDNTQDVVAVQEAMVDLLLMARCPTVFSQHTTSFGHFAHILGGNRLLTVVTDREPLGGWFYVWDEGRHFHTVVLPDEDIAPLGPWLVKSPEAT